MAPVGEKAEDEELRCSQDKTRSREHLKNLATVETLKRQNTCHRAVSALPLGGTLSLSHTFDFRGISATKGAGIQASDDSRFDEIILNLNELVQAEPNNASALVSRGLRYKELGEIDRSSTQYLHGAIQDFTKALELDEHNKVALRNRGMTFLKLTRYDEAIEDLNKALNLEDTLCFKRSPSNGYTLNYTQMQIRAHLEKALELRGIEKEHQLEQPEHNNPLQQKIAHPSRGLENWSRMSIRDQLAHLRSNQRNTVDSVHFDNLKRQGGVYQPIPELANLRFCHVRTINYSVHAPLKGRRYQVWLITQRTFADHGHKYRNGYGGVARFIQHNFADGTYQRYIYNSTAQVGRGRWEMSAGDYCEFESTLGLQWEATGYARPSTGVEIQSAALAEALRHKLTLSIGELDSLSLPPLQPDSFIKVDNKYFKPAAQGEQTEHAAGGGSMGEGGCCGKEGSCGGRGVSLRAVMKGDADAFRMDVVAVRLSSERRQRDRGRGRDRGLGGSGSGSEDGNGKEIGGGGADDVHFYTPAFEAYSKGCLVT